MDTDNNQPGRLDNEIDATDAPTPTGTEERRPSLAEEREARADEREAGLDARQGAADARDAAQRTRDDQVQDVLARAGRRDGQAEARDSAADSRDHSASLHSFLHDEEFVAALRARRFAALDRLDSAADRMSAASDRVDLIEGSDHAPAALDGD